MHIAVDLDGTLAHYDRNKRGEIGEPISDMVQQVKRWQDEGHKIHIFTARVSSGETETARANIYAWLDQHGLSVESITATKHKHFGSFYDDKGFHVARNTGEICPLCHSGGRKPL